MKNEISISDILHAILSHIVIILISALVCGVAAFGITKTLIKPTYKASITLYAVSNINQDAAQISVGEQNASAQLATTYALVLKSNSVMTAVSDALTEKGLDYKAGALKSMTTTSSTETQVFGVTVTAKSPTETKLIADTIADVAPQKIIDIVGSGEVRVVDYAQLPTVPSSPNITSNTTIGVLIGLLAACFFVIIKTLTDTTIWTEDDIAKQIDVPILGTVPQLGRSDKESTGKE